MVDAAASGLGLGMGAKAWAEIISSVFVALACLLSFAAIYMHLKYNKHPIIRNYIIRILLMVPIYSIEAWLGLHFLSLGVIFGFLRDFYEAFVIASFTQFLLTYLGGPEQLSKALAASGEPMSHLFPCCCLARWKMGPQFLRYTLFGVLQYVPISIVNTIVQFVAWMGGWYNDGKFDVYSAFPYCLFIRNASQLWALYCLVLLYQACREEMAGIRALPKFLSVKVIVFVTFWQGVVITALENLDLVQVDNKDLVDAWSHEDVRENIGNALQDFIICIEMLLCAVAHIYAFPSNEFQRPMMQRKTSSRKVSRRNTQGMGNKFASGVNFLDIYTFMGDVADLDTNKRDSRIERQSLVAGQSRFQEASDSDSGSTRSPRYADPSRSALVRSGSGTDRDSTRLV